MPTHAIALSIHISVDLKRLLRFHQSKIPCHWRVTNLGAIPASFRDELQR